MSNERTISELSDEACVHCGAPADLRTEGMRVVSNIGEDGAHRSCSAMAKHHGGHGPREWVARTIEAKAVAA